MQRTAPAGAVILVRHGARFIMRTGRVSSHRVQLFDTASYYNTTVIKHFERASVFWTEAC